MVSTTNTTSSMIKRPDGLSNSPSPLPFTPHERKKTPSGSNTDTVFKYSSATYRFSSESKAKALGAVRCPSEVPAELIFPKNSKSLETISTPVVSDNPPATIGIRKLRLATKILSSEGLIARSLGCWKPLPPWSPANPIFELYLRSNLVETILYLLSHTV